MKSKTLNTIAWVIVFSIAMGFLETAIVIYLRKLYYPEGFAFPLKMMGRDIITTEILREFTTLVMLAGISIIAGRKNIERLGYFLLSFAVWDIFYYVFLNIMLNWPESFLTWDVLFLIPITWVGPVIAPIINSLTMIVLAMSIIYSTNTKGNAVVRKTDWILLIGGSLVVIFSYIQDYSAFLLGKFSFSQLLDSSNLNDIISYACTYIPQYFNWWIFGSGVLMHIAAIAFIILRNLHRTNKNDI
jgi:hypothetical protein